MIATKAIVKRMNMTEIKEKARALGIIHGKMKKAELVHNIQTAEGCIPCYGESNGECAHTDCCFLQDCLKISLAEQDGRQGAVDKKVQHKKAKCQRTQKKTRQHHEQFDQYLECKIARREQAEKDLLQLQARLDNIISIIQNRLTTTKKSKRSKRSKRSKCSLPGN